MFLSSRPGEQLPFKQSSLDIMLLSISVTPKRHPLYLFVEPSKLSKQKGETIQEVKIQTTHLPPLDPKTLKNVGFKAFKALKIWKL